LEHVGLDERRLGASVHEHAVGEVEPDGPIAPPLQLAAEVAGAAREVGDEGTPGQPQRGDRRASPAHVEAEGHHAVHQVVAR
jgi:hypothetical protein